MACVSSRRTVAVVRHFTSESAAAYVRAHGRDMRSRTVVSAEVLEHDIVWHTTSGDELRAAASDVLVCDGTDRWTVRGDVFAATYEPVPGGWRKTATTRLARVDEPFTVETFEGVASGAAGDYLACGELGDVWAVPAAHAAAHYEPIAGRTGTKRRTATSSGARSGRRSS